MRYAAIAECATTYPVAHLCRALQVSESGYYAWRRRQPSQRQQQDTLLGEQLTQMYHLSRATYGRSRLHAEPQATGHRCGRKRVIRLMRQRGLSAQRHRHHCRTTDSQHANPVAPQSPCTGIHGDTHEREMGRGQYGSLDGSGMALCGSGRGYVQSPGCGVGDGCSPR
jgi:hypothetical protein